MSTIIELATAQNQEEIKKGIEDILNLIKQDTPENDISPIDKLILTGAYTAQPTDLNINYIWNSDKMGEVMSLIIPDHKQEFADKTTIESIIDDKSTRDIVLSNHGAIDTAMKTYGVKNKFISRIDVVIDMLKSTLCKDYILSDKNVVNNILNNVDDFNKFFEAFKSDEQMQFNIMNSEYPYLKEKLNGNQEIITYWLNYGNDSFLSFKQLFTDLNALKNSTTTNGLQYSYLEFCFILQNIEYYNYLCETDTLDGYVKSEDIRIQSMIWNNPELYTPLLNRDKLQTLVFNNKTACDMIFTSYKLTDEVFERPELYNKVFTSKIACDSLFVSNYATEVVFNSPEFCTTMFNSKLICDSMFSFDLSSEKVFTRKKLYDEVIKTENAYTCMSQSKIACDKVFKLNDACEYIFDTAKVYNTIFASEIAYTSLFDSSLASEIVFSKTNPSNVIFTTENLYIKLFEMLNGYNALFNQSIGSKVAFSKDYICNIIFSDHIIYNNLFSRKVGYTEAFSSTISSNIIFSNETLYNIVFETPAIYDTAFAKTESSNAIVKNINNLLDILFADKTMFTATLKSKIIVKSIVKNATVRTYMMNKNSILQDINVVKQFYKTAKSCLTSKSNTSQDAVSNLNSNCTVANSVVFASLGHWSSTSQKTNLIHPNNKIAKTDGTHYRPGSVTDANVNAVSFTNCTFTESGDAYAAAHVLQSV